MSSGPTPSSCKWQASLSVTREMEPSVVGCRISAKDNQHTNTCRSCDDHRNTYIPNKSQQLLSAARTAKGYYRCAPLFCI